VNPPKLLNRVRPGPQKQVIGVGQQDADAEILVEIARTEAFDCRLRTDRHENGRFDSPMGGMEQPGARTGRRTLGNNFKLDGHR
jgi:hypothetical protein